MKIEEISKGIFMIDNKLSVLNKVHNFNPFRDQEYKIDNKEYIEWNPNRSKFAAAIVKGIKIIPIKPGVKILYLGAAHGYTCSKISSIIDDGIIYAIEFSDRCFRELLPIAEKYKNISPILADARKPEDYDWIEECDIVYVDIAQPDQTEIALRNAKKFLKAGGYLMIAIKSQSIDVTRSSREVVRMESKKIEEAKFKIVDWKMLEPFEEKHGFIVAQK